MTSVRVNAAFALVGNAIYSACQLVTLVLIARLGSPAAVGQFTLALAITAPVLLLANLQLRHLLASDATGTSAFPQYLALRLITTAIAVLVLIGIACTHHDDGDTGVILAITCAKGLEGLSEMAYGLWQRNELLNRIARSMAIKGISGTLAVALVLWNGGSVTTAAWAMAGTWLIVMLLIDLFGVLQMVGSGPLRPHFNPTMTLRLLREALPMGVVATLLSLGSIIPSYLLEHWYGHEALGRFSPVLYLLAAGNLVILAAGSAALPRLASYFQDGNRHGFTWLALKLIGTCLAVGLVGLVLAPLIGNTVLALLFGPAYADDGWILTGLMAAALCGWLASACGYCLTAARRLVIQIPLTAVAAGTGLLASCLLIPAHGVVGAVWASGIFGAFLAAGYLGVTIHTMRSAGSIRDTSSMNKVTP